MFADDENFSFHPLPLYLSRTQIAHTFIINDAIFIKCVHIFGGAFDSFYF
jgi:hypothetical protein